MSINVSTINEKPSLQESENKLTKENEKALTKSSSSGYRFNIQELPEDCVIEIFSYLKLAEFARCCSVCKGWDSNKKVAKSLILKEFAFGKEKWGKYLGDVGEEPPLPDNIFEILESRLKRQSTKFDYFDIHHASPKLVIKEDHLPIAKSHWLVLIPEKVKGISLTIRNFVNLLESSMTGFKTGLIISELELLSIDNSILDKSVEKSYWVLMTNYLVDDTKGKTYNRMKSKMEELAKLNNINCRLPKMIEAAVCILTNYLETGKCQFDDRILQGSLSFPNATNCEESILIPEEAESFHALAYFDTTFKMLRLSLFSDRNSDNLGGAAAVILP